MGGQTTQEMEGQYMTLLERDEKMREEGRKEGAESEALDIIRNIMKVQHKTAEEANESPFLSG